MSGLQKLLNEIEADPSLAEPARFRERTEALDRLDLYDLDAQTSIPDTASVDSALYRRAIALRTKLEGANSTFYEKIRDSIRRGVGGDALLRWAPQTGRDASRHDDGKPSDSGDSYDYLDELVGGVLRFASPDATFELSPEMVAYQPTPARHVFDLIGRIPLTAQDVFIDLGSGLGHVPLLVAICTDAHTIGIELDPSYVACSQRSAQELNLANVTFLAQDAREADLSSGTVFYLYTPFRGAILSAVLDRLRAQANTREIRVCTFGPCTPIFAAESWLALDSAESGNISVFRSRK